MRILFDSKLEKFKKPFGALKTGQVCFFNILVPKSCPAKEVYFVIESENGEKYIGMMPEEYDSDYVKFKTELILEESGVYFYWFYVKKDSGSFRLFKQGNDTNMEAGEKWQITCYDKDYAAPEWAKGAVIYQIFPDRFYISGTADLSEKITPYKVHQSILETPDWFPDENGNWNNDFYGGNLRGIIEKLDYLTELGVDVIYLNPIVKAFSNHRYDTADYKQVDPMLGTADDFKRLCAEAHLRNIKIIVDGVFSHTGNKSVYFENAVRDKNSPYRDWYEFEQFPNKYRCWWGIDTLPQVKRNHKGFESFVASGEDSIIDFWLGLGADGIRLDVADELSDSLIKAIFKKTKEVKSDALVMGEVWEDASNKISYGERRKYLLGEQLDSVMNYPFLNLICAFVKCEISPHQFAEGIMTIVENYPEEILHCCMNMLSTHDTIRIITRLGADNLSLSKEEKANHKLSRRDEAEKLVKIASFLQFMLPGAPSIYYGDDIGMEGFEDPFNRRFFRWDKTECNLQSHFKQLCRLKHTYPSLQKGNIRFSQDEKVFGFSRSFGDETVYIVVNMSDESYEFHHTPIFFENLNQGTLQKFGYALYQ